LKPQRRIDQNKPSRQPADTGKLWLFPVVIALAASGLAACGNMPAIEFGPVAEITKPKDFTGLVAADEPQAVLAAQQIMLAKGNAADTAVALGFALTVTMPARAGLGAGGACLVHDVKSSTTEALVFPPEAPGNSIDARFRAAVPALPRALFALHAKYGSRPWQQLVTPAENLARFGFPVSQAFSRDLSTAGGAITAHREALSTFMTSRRQLVTAGDTLRQLDLATVLGRLRGRGPGDLYAGAFGRDVEAAVIESGSVITAQDLRATTPRWVAAVSAEVNGLNVFTLPANIAGGNIAALGEVAPSPEPYEPAATGFAVADANGNVVTCAITMGKAFGLGIMPRGLGFLLAPSPEVPGYAAQPLAALIAVSRANGQVKFAAASGGTDALPHTVRIARAVLAEGTMLADAAKANTGSAPVNALACRNGLQTDGKNCEASADPAGAGYALIIGPED